MKTFDDDEEEEEGEKEERNGGPDNMARNILQVQSKLMATGRFFVGSDLNKHLREIDQNSQAVAHVSRNHYKTKILNLCEEVCNIRNYDDQSCLTYYDMCMYQAKGNYFPSMVVTSRSF